LRHTATSLLKNAGVSEAVARHIIGHESAPISRHYTHIDESSKRKALAKLPDVTALPLSKKPEGSKIEREPWCRLDLLHLRSRWPAQPPNQFFVPETRQSLDVHPRFLIKKL
jgi:hypothetical protein